MSNEYEPESIIIVHGSLGDIERARKCTVEKRIRIYCSNTTSCKNCEIYKDYEDYEKNHKNEH